MIFWVNKDRVVRAGGHTSLAADADRLVEINNPIGALEHRSGGAGGDTRRVRALIAAGYLMRAPDLRKHAHVDVLDVGAGDANRHDVLRLAGRRARMATDTAGLVDHLGPLNRGLASWLWLDHSDI